MLPHIIPNILAGIVCVLLILIGIYLTKYAPTFSEFSVSFLNNDRIRVLKVWGCRVFGAFFIIGSIYLFIRIIVLKP